MTTESSTELPSEEELNTIEIPEDPVVEELDFDQEEEIEIPVKYKGKNYVLKEATGKGATIYRNATMACITFGADGKAQRVSNLASVEPLLVSQCLYYGTGHDRKLVGKLVPQSVIETWPSKLQKKLYEKAKEISDLSEGTSERQLLEKALSLMGSPISLGSIRAYVESLDKEQFASLQRWLKPTPEEKAKNEQSDTTAG